MNTPNCAKCAAILKTNGNPTTTRITNPFSMPYINPATDRASTAYYVAGDLVKIAPPTPACGHSIILDTAETARCAYVCTMYPWTELKS